MSAPQSTSSIRSQRIIDYATNDRFDGRFPFTASERQLVGTMVEMGLTPTEKQYLASNFASWQQIADQTPNRSDIHGFLDVIWAKLWPNAPRHKTTHHKAGEAVRQTRSQSSERYRAPRSSPGWSGLVLQATMPDSSGAAADPLPIAASEAGSSAETGSATFNCTVAASGVAASVTYHVGPNGAYHEQLLNQLFTDLNGNGKISLATGNQLPIQVRLIPVDNPEDAIFRCSEDRKEDIQSLFDFIRLGLVTEAATYAQSINQGPVIASWNPSEPVNGDLLPPPDQTQETASGEGGFWEGKGPFWEWLSNFLMSLPFLQISIGHPKYGTGMRWITIDEAEQIAAEEQVRKHGPPPLPSNGELQPPGAGITLAPDSSAAPFLMSNVEVSREQYDLRGSSTLLTHRIGGANGKYYALFDGLQQNTLSTIVFAQRATQANFNIQKRASRVSRNLLFASIGPFDSQAKAEHFSAILLQRLQQAKGQ